MPSLETDRFGFVALGIASTLGVVALVISLAYRSEFPYSSDSAAYLQQARSLIRGGGLACTPWGLEELDRVSAPTPAFPPGYPIAVAAMSKLLPISVEKSAVLLNYTALALLPLLVFLSIRKTVGSTWAVLTAGLGSLTPAIIQSANLALSDVFSLAFVVASFGLVLNGHRASIAIAAGILAGLAYSTRNAHVAFLMASAVFLTYRYLCNRSRSEHVFVLSWLLGVAVILIPLFWRNIALFGTPSPYSMAPSTVPLVENVRGLTFWVLADAIGHQRPAQWLAGSASSAVIFLILAVGLGGIRFRRRGHLGRDLRLCATFSALCAVFVAVVIVFARTKYQLDMIGARFILQITPFVFITAACLVRAASNRWLRVCVGGLVATFCLARAWFAIGPLRVPAVVEQLPELRAFMAGADVLCSQTGDVLRVSNFGWVFNILCDGRVRHPGFVVRPGSLEQSYSSAGDAEDVLSAIGHVRERTAPRHVLMALFPGQLGFRASDFPLREPRVTRLSRDEWRIERNTPDGLVLRR